MPRWTEEARAAQRERAIKSKPWEKSTGPKTKEGKAKVARNPIKHGLRSKEGEELRKVLAKQARYLRAVKEMYGL